jgi:transcriptional antiterminator RfaH
MENLERQGFRGYCPRIWKRVRHARRSLDVLRPLFPGYLFVQVNLENWRPILSTVGVRSLVRCGDQLSVLSGEFVDSLKARESNGAIVPPEWPFQVGQQVRLEGSAFDGVVATIINLDEKGRVVVLMELLSRSVKVHVAARDLATL